MARIRTIKPTFFTSLTVADLTPEQRLTFIGLWTHVDDEGRCVDDARLVKAALWPLDEHVTAQVVETHLRTLSESSLIARYEVNGRRFLQVSGWGEHQKINRPTPSVFPGPESGQIIASEPNSGQSLNAHAQLSEDSRGEGNREQGTGNRENTPSTDADRDEVAEQFNDEFWPIYPPTNGRKPEKGKALTQWRKLTADQRARALVGARHLAAADTIPKHAFRFLRKDTAGEFPFDDWQTPAAPTARASPGAAQPPPRDADYDDGWTGRSATA